MSGGGVGRDYRRPAHWYRVVWVVNLVFWALDEDKELSRYLPTVPSYRLEDDD